MLDRVRDGLADYIRKNKLEKPVIVGHSLGGFLALALAAKYPNLPGKLVIVDAYPFFGGSLRSRNHPGQGPRERRSDAPVYGRANQDMYERLRQIGRSHQDDGDQGYRL